MTRSNFLIPFAVISLAALLSDARAQSLDLAKPDVAKADPEASFCTTGAAPGTSTPGGGGYGLYRVDGLYFADLIPAAPTPPACLWATPGRYRLDLPQIPGLGDARLNLRTGVNVTSLAGENRRIVASTISPVLCTSFLNLASLPNGLTLNSLYALQLTNGGGQRIGEACSTTQPGSDPARCLWGLRNLAVQFGQGTAASRISGALASADTGLPYVQCYDATMANAPLSAPPAAEGALFTDGFETPAPDVRVRFVADTEAQEPIEQWVHTVNVPGAYRVLVSNRSSVPLSGVRLREFIPAAGGPLSPVVNAVSCSELGGQAPAACPGNTLDMQIDLAAHQTRVFRVERQVVSSVAIDPAVGGLLAVAAFVNPALGADANAADNVRSLRLGAVTLPSYLVNASVQGGNGTVSPGSQQITQGQTASFTLAPAANFQVNTASDNCGVGGSSAGTRNGLSYSIPNITQACTVTVSYRPVQHAVTANAAANGSVTPPTQQVDHGATASFTVTSTVGYTAAGNAGSADCGTVTNNGGDAWVAGPITGVCAVNFTFSQNQYTVTPVAVGNGTVSPSIPQTVAHGQNTFFTLTPDANHRIASATGCGGTLSGNNYLINNLQGSCTVTATFELMIHSFGAAATTNGSIGIADPNVVHGSSGSFTVTPDTGYSTGVVSGTPACGTLVQAGGVNWNTGAITSSGCVVSANFNINQYLVRVTTSGGNGTIGNPAGTDPIEQTVNYNSTASVRVDPATGYNPVFTPSVGSCTFSDPEQDGIWTSSAIAGDCTVNVGFAINVYAVTGGVVGSGSITPVRNIEHNDFGVFVLTPVPGNVVDSVTDNCGAGGAANGSLNVARTQYTVGPITGACHVTATFVPNP